MIRFLYFISPLLTILLFLNGCEKDFSPVFTTVAPCETSRDFEWNIDTLAPPDAYWISMYDIWGTDENNVWCVGISNRRKYQIWHWDGLRWRYVDPNIPGERPSYDEIFGFSKEDFWIIGNAGNHGYVLHYDGVWKRVDNNDLVHCFSIWGNSSQNLFIGGRHGVIYKYNGTKFTRYEKGRNLQITTIWGLETGEVFAIGVNNDNQPAEPPTRYMFEYTQDGFALLDSCITTLPGDQTIGMDLWGTDLNHLYTPNGDGLAKYDNGEWVTQFYATLFRIHGSSPCNIFTSGYKDVIYHYNGNDWAAVRSSNEFDNSTWGIWCNDSTVFVIQHPQSFTRIVRGKIK